MNARLRHQLTDDAVLVTATAGPGVVMSVHLSEGEARRFAWSVLSDLEPESLEQLAPRGDRAVVLKRLLRIKPAAARLLAHLIDRPNEIHAGQALRDAIGSKGGHGVVSVYAHEINRALAAKGAEARIEAHNGKGYTLSRAHAAEVLSLLGGVA